MVLTARRTFVTKKQKKKKFRSLSRARQLGQKRPSHVRGGSGKFTRFSLLLLWNEVRHRAQTGASKPIGGVWGRPQVKTDNFRVETSQRHPLDQFLMNVAIGGEMERLGEGTASRGFTGATCCRGSKLGEHSLIMPETWLSPSPNDQN